VIAYRTAWSVAVSLGDPVGPDDRLGALVPAFAAFCAENGWKPAFHQVLPDLLPAYGSLGFGVLKIGEEVMVDLARFAAETSQHPTFRKPRRQLPAEGYRVVRQAAARERAPRRGARGLGQVAVAAGTPRARVRARALRPRLSLAGVARARQGSHRAPG
jgi:lysylphosphatidylglycerol synthetase-like protein (DUF2156 family)